VTLIVTPNPTPRKLEMAKWETGEMGSHGVGVKTSLITDT